MTVRHVWIPVAFSKEDGPTPIIPSGRAITCCSSHMNGNNLHANRSLHAFLELRAVFQHFTVELVTGQDAAALCRCQLKPSKYQALCFTARLFIEPVHGSSKDSSAEILPAPRSDFDIDVVS